MNLKISFLPLTYPQKEKDLHFIDHVLLSAVAIFYFLYSLLYKSDFPEIHLQLSFLNFPLFISEILLGFCLVLSLVKLSFYWPLKLTKWHRVIIAYVIFVTFKTLYGYIYYGPLAMRHAAMFYYPLFAVMTYYAFDTTRKLTFSSSFQLIVFFLVEIIVNVYDDLGYFLFPYMILGLVLALGFRGKKMRYLSILIVLLATPYAAPFNEARGINVASILTYILLFMLSMAILSFKRKEKLLVGLMAFSILAISFYLLTPEKIRTSLTAPTNIIAIYKEEIERIKKEEKYYIAETIKPRLYNPNREIREEIAKKRKNRPTYIVAGSEANSSVQAEIVAGSEANSSVQAEIVAGSEANSSVQAAIEKSIYKYGTIMFRLHIVHDMIEQLIESKPLLGFSFGKPFRSKHLEITGNAREEWLRDGWVTSHNSFMEVIYRTGLAGILFLILLLGNVSSMCRTFIKAKSKAGVLLVGIIFYWLMCCFFYIIFEMPYLAIPFWSFYGIVLAYSHYLKGSEIILNKETV